MRAHGGRRRPPRRSPSGHHPPATGPVSIGSSRSRAHSPVDPSSTAAPSNPNARSIHHTPGRPHDAADAVEHHSDALADGEPPHRVREPLRGRTHEAEPAHSPSSNRVIAASLRSTRQAPLPTLPSRRRRHLQCRTPRPVPLPPFHPRFRLCSRPIRVNLAHRRALHVRWYGACASLALVYQRGASGCWFPVSEPRDVPCVKRSMSMEGGTRGPDRQDRARHPASAGPNRESSPGRAAAGATCGAVQGKGDGVVRTMGQNKVVH